MGVPPLCPIFVGVFSEPAYLRSSWPGNNLFLMSAQVLRTLDAELRLEEWVPRFLQFLSATVPNAQPGFQRQEPYNQTDLNVMNPLKRQVRKSKSNSYLTMLKSNTRCVS